MSELPRFPRRVEGPMWKGEGSGSEATNKKAVRARDGRRCRFPLCGCRGKRLEVSHDRHKGSGGDPRGIRSTTGGMILLCVVRHQTGRISRHAGTLRNEPLTANGNDGPVRWLVACGALLEVMRAHRLPLPPEGLPVLEGYTELLVEIARERGVQELEPLEEWQRRILKALAAQCRAV